MTFGLDPRTLSRMHGVFRAFPEVEEVMVYGSRAMGTYREGSDIDLNSLERPSLRAFGARLGWP